MGATANTPDRVEPLPDGPLADTVPSVPVTLEPAADEPRAPDGTLAPGATLGEAYRVEGVLGRGGMGVVYLVEHVDLGRRFAAKVVARGRMDSERLARLRKEARVASTIRHPNIVDVVNLGTQPDGSVFVVMELLEGEDLGARLERVAEDRPEAPWLEFGAARRYADQIFRGLAAAHAAGVIHRDLKPDNVFLATTGDDEVAKLVDFGIAKSIDAKADLRLTSTDQIIGTPLYMAPEQARSTADVDERADLYALGVILYEMVTGAPPFDAETVYDIIIQHATEPPRPPRSLRPDLPAAVEAVILRCLAKQPEARFEGVDELARAWRDAWESESAPSVEPVRPRPARRWPIALGAAAAIAAGLTAAWVAWSPPSTARPSAPAPVAADRAPEPAPEPTAASVTRELTSTPSGAEVLRDGRRLGTTPLSLEVAPGETIVIEVRAPGHAPASLEVDGATDQVLAVELAPTRRGRRRGRRRPPAASSSEAPSAPPATEPGGLLVGVEAFDAERAE